MQPSPEASSSDLAARWLAFRSGLIAILVSGGGSFAALLLSAKTGWPAAAEARGWLIAGLMALAAGGLAWGLSRLGRARAGRFDALGWLALGLQVPAWLALFVAAAYPALMLFGGYRGD